MFHLELGGGIFVTHFVTVFPPLSDPQSSSPEYTTYACDGDLLRLECPSESDVIRVTRANYGR